MPTSQVSAHRWRRCKRCAGAALCVLVVSLGAFGAAAQHIKDSRTFRTRAYEVTTDVDAATARTIAKHMDKVFAEYSTRLSSFNVRNSSRVRLYLLRTEDGYHEFLDSQGIDGSNSGGMFFWRGGEAGLATYVEGQPPRRMLHVLQHEGFHQFAHLRIGDTLPIWANEGLAEYFGQGIMVRKKMALGMVPEARLRRVVNEIKAKKHISFDELVNMTGATWNKRLREGHPQASFQYDQSWAVVHFLIHSDRGKYAKPFEAYLRSVSNGTSPRKAFSKAFGSNDTKPFEQAWINFMLDLKPDPVSTGADRLEFLAEGLQFLHKAGRTPRSMDELKMLLQRAEFRLTRVDHGVRRAFDAADDANFEAPAPESTKRRRPSEIELIVSEDPGTLPPGVRITGLRVVPLVIWSAAPDGELAYEIEFR